MRNRIINSTTYLIAAYFIVHFVSLVSQYIIIKAFSLRDAVMYFFYNDYSSPVDSWWTRVKIFLIFGIGIFMVFILLVLVSTLYLNLSRKDFKLSVFYNWIIIISSAFIISNFFAAPFFNETSSMYFVLLWLRFEGGGSGMYVLAILSLPLIPLVGYFTKDSFLKMTNTTKLINSKFARSRLYLYTAWIPFFILAIILYLLVYNVYTYSMLQAATYEGMRILILGAILICGNYFSYNKKYISIQKSNTTHLLNIQWTALVIVIVTALYIVLWLNMS